MITLSVLLRLRNVSGVICKENQNTYTYFMFSKFPPPPSENHGVDVVMLKNVVRVRLQMKKWRTRFACWVPNTINILAICNTYCFSIAK
jgi:hypothetical protein